MGRRGGNLGSNHFDQKRRALVLGFVLDPYVLFEHEVFSRENQEATMRMNGVKFVGLLAIVCSWTLPSFGQGTPADYARCWFARAL